MRDVVVIFDEIERGATFLEYAWSIKICSSKNSWVFSLIQARRKNCWGSHWLLSSSASLIGNETWPFGSCMGVGHIHRSTKEIRDNWKTYYTKCIRNFYVVASGIYKKKNHQRVTFKYLPGFESTRLVYENTKQVKNVVTLLFFFYSCYNHRERIKQRNKQANK